MALARLQATARRVAANSPRAGAPNKFTSVISNAVAKKKAYMERAEREFHQKVVEGARGERLDADTRNLSKAIAEALEIPTERRDDAMRPVKEMLRKQNESIILLCFDAVQGDLTEAAELRRKYASLVNVNRESQSKHIKEVNQLREALGRRPDPHNSSMSADDVLLYDGLNSLDEELKDMCMDVINERVRQILQKPNKALADIIKKMFAEGGMPSSWEEFLDGSITGSESGSQRLRKAGAGAEDDDATGAGRRNRSGRRSSLEHARHPMDAVRILELERQIAQLKSDLLDAVRVKDDLQTKAGQQDEHTKTEEKKQEEAKKTQAKVEEQKEEMQRLQEFQREARQKLSAEAEKLKVDLAAITAEKEKLEAEKEALKTQLEGLQTHYSKFDKETARKDRELAKMKKECDRLRAENKKMEGEWKDGQEKVQHLREISQRRASQSRLSLLGAEGIDGQTGAGSGLMDGGRTAAGRTRGGHGQDVELTEIEKQKQRKQALQSEKKKFMKKLLRVLREQHVTEESAASKPGLHMPIESNSILGPDAEKHIGAAALVALLEKESKGVFADVDASSSSSEDLPVNKKPRELVQYRTAHHNAYHGPIIRHGVQTNTNWKVALPDVRTGGGPGTGQNRTTWRQTQSCTDLSARGPSPSPALRNLKKGIYAEASNMKVLFEEPFEQMLQHSNIHHSISQPALPATMSCVHGSGVDTCPACAELVPKLSLGWCLPPLASQSIAR